MLKQFTITLLALICLLKLTNILHLSKMLSAYCDDPDNIIPQVTQYVCTPKVCMITMAGKVIMLISCTGIQIIVVSWAQVIYLKPQGLQA